MISMISASLSQITFKKFVTTSSPSAHTAETVGILLMRLRAVSGWDTELALTLELDRA